MWKVARRWLPLFSLLRQLKTLCFFKNWFLFLGVITGGPYLGFWAFTAVALVQPLVGDVRPHKLYGMEKKKDLLASTFEIIN